MFFKKNNKLEEKDEQISILQMAIKELNSEKDHNLNLKAEEIKKLNKKLNRKIRELEEKEKELEHKTQELENSVDNLEKATSTDSLTGAYNRRYFYDVAENIISLAKRDKGSLSLAILEIDKFDEINKIGDSALIDKVLQTFVHNISLRESDLFVRFSDNEFVILFPNTNSKQAEIVAQKIRENIQSNTFLKSIELTTSLCITEYIVSEDNINSALKRVSSALRESGTNTLSSI